MSKVPTTPSFSSLRNTGLYSLEGFGLLCSFPFSTAKGGLLRFIYLLYNKAYCGSIALKTGCLCELMGTVSSGLATVSSIRGVPIHLKTGVPVHLGKTFNPQAQVWKSLPWFSWGGTVSSDERAVILSQGGTNSSDRKIPVAFENANARFEMSRQSQEVPRGTVSSGGLEAD